MPKPKAEIAIGWREQGGEMRAFLDLRKYGGPRREALKEPGQSWGTTDPARAVELAAARVAELVAAKKEQARRGLDADLELSAYANQHIEAKELSGSYTPEWLTNLAAMLDRAVRFFNEVQPPLLLAARTPRRVLLPRNLQEISTPDVRDFGRWVAQQPNGRGGTYGPQSVRHHLFALSGVYRRAISDGALRSGNPVSDLLDKPSIPDSPTPLLEAEEVALAIEGARLVQAEARESGDERATGRRMVHVALVLLAYTGTRWDECERIAWSDLLAAGDDEYVVRIHGAAKGAHAGRRRKVRLVPLSPHAVPILLQWRRDSGRLSGPILADPATGAVPALGKALRAVERRTGLADGVLGSRTMRVAYATHRATCTGVTWNDIRDELGHADLRMMGTVYGRGRVNREPMGDDLDYRWERWARLLPEAATQLAGSAATPTRWEVGRGERESVIRDFLARIEGLGTKRAQMTTGVDRAAIQRLRQGKAGDVKGSTLAAMRAYLAGDANERREA